MNKILLFLLSLLALSINASTLDDTPVTTAYTEAYNKAKDLVDYWLDCPGMPDKTQFKTLKSATTLYAPEKVTTESRMKSATTTLNTYITKFETLLTSIQKTTTDKVDMNGGVDPNFHIYLCFGQSNMQGYGPIQDQDRTDIDPRFLMMAPVDFTSNKRTMGFWYTAKPPLCRDDTHLCPADYFGREMVANLPDSVKVGVINVAVGGASIKLFDQGLCASQIKNAEDWFKNWCKPYNNDPYQRIVDCAKWAQKVGVIKGILLHQGCTDDGDKEWPARVKRVYTRLINDLNLNESETPLLTGELLHEDVGGQCYKHNEIIGHITDAVPNAYVISSEGCPGQSDGLHFTSEANRIIGRRYATAMLQALGQTRQIDFDTSDECFPLTEGAFRPSIYKEGTFSVSAAGIQQTSIDKGNMCGWRYSKGMDFSAFKYLIVKLSQPATCAPTVRIYDIDDCISPCYEVEMGQQQTICIDLHTMTTSAGNAVDPSHIYLVGLTTDATSPLHIQQVYLSDDGETPTDIIYLAEDSRTSPSYDLSGKAVSHSTKGIYIVNGKKVVKK